MVHPELLTFLVVAHGLVINGAAVYRTDSAVPNVPQLDLASPALQNTHVQPPLPDQDLENDLDNVRMTGNSEQNSNGAPANPPAVQVPENDEAKGDDELDIQLLYDLIRAVEYEANAQLFNSVLQDLDKSNYPSRPAPAPIAAGSQSQGHPDVDQMDRNAQLQNTMGTGANAADDNNGMVTAQKVPANPGIPLHKRLATALRDVPGAGPVYPVDALAEKRNMFKKTTA